MATPTKGERSIWSTRLHSVLLRSRAVLHELASDFREAPCRLLMVTVLSLLGWACFVAAMVACVAAFLPSRFVGAGLALTVVTNLGAAIPSSPAGIGVYHALAVMTLVAFGTPAADALAVAIVSHGLVVATQLALGGGALAVGGSLVRGWRAVSSAR